MILIDKHSYTFDKTQEVEINQKKKVFRRLAIKDKAYVLTKRDSLCNLFDSIPILPRDVLHLNYKRQMSPEQLIFPSYSDESSDFPYYLPSSRDS